MFRTETSSKPLVLEYMNDLPDGYRQVVDKLIRKCNDSLSLETNNERVEALYPHFQPYVSTYTVLPILMDYWQDLIDSTEKSCHDEVDDFQAKLLWDYPAFPECNHRREVPKEWPDLLFDINKDYIVNPYSHQFRHRVFQDKNLNAESFLIFPHSNLKVAYNLYEQHSNEPISPELKEKFAQACEIYSEMEAIDIRSDAKKYIEVLKKTNNDIFVVKNLECQIVKTPWVQSLWFEYIGYLENDLGKPRDAFDVALRYCRLFINDAETRQKYLSKIPQYLKTDRIDSKWIDAINFELQYGSKALAKQYLASTNERCRNLMPFVYENCEFYQWTRLADVVKLLEQELATLGTTTLCSEQVMKAIDFKNYKPQTFSVGEKITTYLMNNTNYTVLRKLYQTCKFFFAKVQLAIVHRLCVKFKCNDPAYFEFKNLQLTIGNENYQNLPLPKMWLTNTCSLYHNVPENISQRIIRNNLRHLDIHGATMKYWEFEALVASPDLITLGIHDVRILNTKGYIELDLDDILAMAPTARYIRFNPCRLSCSAEALLNVKRKAKLDYLNLELDDNFKTPTPGMDPKSFWQSLKIHLAPRATFNLFSFTIPLYVQDVKKCFEAEEPRNEGLNFMTTHIEML